MNNQVDAEAQEARLYPARPTATADVESRVPVPVLEEIADRHAQEVWGEEVGRGEPFPVADATGTVRAYVIPYVRGQRHFPADEVILDEVSAMEARGVAGEAADEHSAEWSRFGERFGAIYVSATNRQFPIELVSHYLHPFFLVGRLAQAEAIRRLDRSDVSLERIRFVNPHEEFFEFVAGDAHLLVDVHSRSAEVPERVPAAEPTSGPRSAQPDEAITAVWRRALDHTPLALNPNEAGRTHTESKIPYWQLVPPIPYTWWCVPTAYNMIMGYWDHYVPGLGSFTGYGRVISHWYEHVLWCHRPDGWDEKCTVANAIPNNVPSITDELIDPSTGTWRTGFKDFADFVSKMYKYTFTTGGPNDGEAVDATNDWAWQDIVNEVNAGRPFFWSFDAHTVVGIGYRVDSNGQKYVIYLDTYGATLTQKLKELSYEKGNAFTWLKPGGGTDGEDAILLAPRGGETVHASTPTEIRWCAWGAQDKSANLSVSSDAGKTWESVATGVSSRAGENTYVWMPGPVITKGRVRMQAFVGSDYLAGDGSFENFAVQPQTADGAWSQINDAVGTVLAGRDKSKGTRLIYATDPASGDVYEFQGKPGVYWNWIQVGGPGKMFALDGQGRLFGLSVDGSGVWQYSGTPMQWKEIGGPAQEIYGDVDGVCATNPSTGDLYRYLGAPFAWRKVSDPGKTFASDARGRLYRLSVDGSSVWRYDGLFGPPTQWIKIGGPASNLYARGQGVYATNPQTGDIYFFHGPPLLWTRIGGPAKEFSLDAEGRPYGLSPNGSGVWRYEGSLSAPSQWTKVGGPAANICAGWREILAVNPQTKALWIYPT